MRLTRTDKQILAIALPSVVSNITVPLLGMCDLAIAGHIGDAAFVAAVSVGATLFNVMYWLFGFLRMGTGGLTSQACGREDDAGSLTVLSRALLVAAVISAAVVVVHPWLFDLAFSHVIVTEADVERLARTYLSVCIWGAPAVMMQYCFTGWFIGMQNSRIPMAVSILQNIVNIGASVSFVIFLDMTIDGIALGTLVAQWSALIASAVAWRVRYGDLWRHVRQVRLLELRPMLKFMDLNKDIFLRTLCLVAVTLFFTSSGAAQGDMTVAANALLMQFFTIFSYVMDGLAYAAEALTGKCVGARDRRSLAVTVRRIIVWSAWTVAAFTVAYLVAGRPFVGLLTSDGGLVAYTMRYFPWVLLLPVAGVLAFVWDGVYIGATATRRMLLAMAVATVAFFACHHFLFPLWGNHALWLSFIIYLAARGVVQTLLFPGVLRTSMR